MCGWGGAGYAGRSGRHAQNVDQARPGEGEAVEPCSDLGLGATNHGHRIAISRLDLADEPRVGAGGSASADHEVSARGHPIADGDGDGDGVNVCRGGQIVYGLVLQIIRIRSLIDFTLSVSVDTVI